MSVQKIQALNSNLVIYDKDGKQVYTFYGQVKDNLPNGFGKKVLQNGDSFQGLFQAGVLDGEARLVIDLNIYDCVVESDVLSGYAKVHYHDGRQFFGQLLDGLYSGLGKLLYADGSYFIGLFTKNQRSGIGRMEYENGDVYQGEWANDQRNGHGQLTVASTKMVEAGIWSNDALKEQCAVPLSVVQQVAKQIKDFPLFVEQIVDDIVETNNQQFGKRVNNLSFIRQNSRAMLIQRVDKQPIILQTSLGDDSVSAFYSGETIAGEIYGQGSLTYKNGASYTGAFERGLKSGKGVVRFPNNVQVEGEFVDDHLIEKMENDVFKITKFSVTDLSVEWVYTGNVVDGEPSGFGAKIFSNGTKISCYFNNGNMSGIARKESPDGQVMYGIMENNLFDQYVSIFEGNGDIYIGDFSDELKDGLAYIKWKDGYSYCGNIISAVPHGFGMLSYPDSESVYYGFFSVGKRHGLGVRITSSIVEEGLFENNQFVEQKKVDFAININTNFLKLGQIQSFVQETENQLNIQFGISKILVRDHPIFDQLGNPYAKFYGFVHNGQPIGFGKLVQDNETIYSEFLNGKMNGLSKVVIQNVGVQECRAVNGVFDGLSHVLLQNSDEYYGHLKNSEYYGFGQLITQEQVYVGDFMDGKFHGVGTLHFNNHTKIDYVKGHFEYGKFVNGSIFFNDQTCQHGYFQNFELTGSTAIDVQIEFAVIKLNMKLFEVLKKVRSMQNNVQELINQFESDYKQ